MTSSAGDLKTIQYIYCTVLGIWWFIACPFAFYHCYKIWQFRHGSFFSKRHPVLSIAAVLSIVYWIGIGRPIGDLADMFPFIHKAIPIPISNSPLSQLAILLIYVRIWFLYYDYNYGLQIVSKQWESALLNTSESGIPTQNKYWTLSTTWSHLSYKSYTIYFIVITYVLIIDIILLLIALYDPYLEYYFYSASMGILIIPILILSIKVRRCRDQLYIHAEFKRYAYLGSVVLVSYLSCRFFARDNIPLQKLLRHIFINTEGIFYFYLATKWVIDKYIQRINAHSIQKHSDVPTPTTLPNILQHEDAFELFAVHLVQEFSIENLLFIYEAMKFKEQCVENGFVKNHEIGVVLQFGEKINNSKANELSYEYIVRKYIAVGADHVVNISHATRINMLNLMEYNSETTQSMDKHRIVEYVNSINDAMLEIMRLLSTDSLPRFKRTNTFKHLSSYELERITSVSR